VPDGPDEYFTVTGVYKEWCEKGKSASMPQSCGVKCLVDARGQRRMGWLIQADRSATLTEITTRYNRPRYAANHLWSHNMRNLEADGLQQQ